MDTHELWSTLFATGVIRIGNVHIVLSTGEHTQMYANFVQTNVPSALRKIIIGRLYDLAVELGFVSFPEDQRAVLGIGCGYWYASKLAELLGDIPAAEATKDSIGKHILARDQGSALAGKNVLIVDDVFNSGSTFSELVDLVKRADGYFAGAVFILNRCKQPFPNGMQRKSIIWKFLPVWPNRAKCQLCIGGVPLSIEHGAGADEFHRHGQPPKP